jgi:hypothetical protein
MKKAAHRSLEPREASTLALIAQYISVHPGELPPDAAELRASLGSDANRIVDALVRISKPAKKASSSVNDEYEDAAADLLHWVQTNKSYLQAR